MGDMEDLVRQESRTVAGPADLDVAVDVGRVEVHLEDAGTSAADEDATGANAPGELEIRVEVRHDPAAAGGWAQRLGEVASWLGSVGAAPDTDAGDGPVSAGADAVRATDITWSAPGASGEAPTLTVRSTTELPLRMVPLVVTVWAPAGSRVTARTGAGDVAVTGRAGRATVRTGAGTATTADVDGDAEVTTGSGDVRVGAVAGSTDIKAGNGDVAIGEVRADVGVRTGTGAVSVADALAGRMDLTTGSGGLTIGVHAGVLAELDLSSGSGRARSELDVRQTAPAGEPVLWLRGRTASGDVLVTRAATPA